MGLAIDKEHIKCLYRKAKCMALLGLFKKSLDVLLYLDLVEAPVDIAKEEAEIKIMIE